MRVIAFYLPQFHAIPENDAWWGKGFTEWTNVKKAKPLFRGHYQPRVPADLGYYDLGSEDARIAQAQLAREYGIGAFCYYHYWFNGRMLLERPFNEVLASGRPDFPFCLCWANENWTRRWDGLEREILMGQSYGEYDAAEHMEWLCRAFVDRRYVRVNGRPLFLVYRAEQIPDVGKIVGIWRRHARERIGSEPFLCAVKNNQYGLSDADTVAAGFDAMVEFNPNPHDVGGTAMNIRKASIIRVMNMLIDLLHLAGILAKRSDYIVYDYSRIVENVLRRTRPSLKTFPCIFPSWDNTARRRFGTTVIENSDTGLFQKWLEYSLDRAGHAPPEERIVFINAWNEWAEGCHLEPDTRNGKGFLEAIRRALGNYSRELTSG